MILSRRIRDRRPFHREVEWLGVMDVSVGVQVNCCLVFGTGSFSIALNDVCDTKRWTIGITRYYKANALISWD